MRRAIVDLISPRKAWRAPPATAAAVREALGRGWEVAVMSAFTSSDGDGAEGSAEAREAARDAELYFGWGVPSGVARAARGTLRWAHSAAAGAGGSITPEFRATGAVLTNSAGAYAEPISDWIVAAIGFCLRGFHLALSAQRDRRWAKTEFTDGSIQVREFRGTRLGLVGLGGIGAAVARRVSALGMEVGAVRRHPERRRPRGIDWVGGPGELHELAGRSDVLVLAAPRTAATEQIIDGAVLAALPRGAFVINVGRGMLLDEDALLAELDRGHLAGCVLDVFTAEPLPAEHPFWTHPRVFVSPHVSGVSDAFWERETALIVENVGRYLAGRRLKNVVDLEAGY